MEASAEVLLLLVTDGACRSRRHPAQAAQLALRLLCSAAAAAHGRLRWLHDTASSRSPRAGVLQRRRFAPFELAEFNRLAARLEAAAAAAGDDGPACAGAAGEALGVLKTHVVAALAASGDFVWSSSSQACVGKTLAVLLALPQAESEADARALAARLLPDALARRARELGIRLLLVDTAEAQQSLLLTALQKRLHVEFEDMGAVVSMDMANAAADWSVYAWPWCAGQKTSLPAAQKDRNRRSKAATWVAHLSLAEGRDDIMPECMDLIVGALPSRDEARRGLPRLKLELANVIRTEQLLDNTVGLAPLAISGWCGSRSSGSGYNAPHPWFRALLTELLASNVVLVCRIIPQRETVAPETEAPLAYIWTWNPGCGAIFIRQTVLDQLSAAPAKRKASPACNCGEVGALGAAAANPNGPSQAEQLNLTALLMRAAAADPAEENAQFKWRSVANVELPDDAAVDTARSVWEEAVAADTELQSLLLHAGAAAPNSTRPEAVTDAASSPFQFDAAESAAADATMADPAAAAGPFVTALQSHLQALCGDGDQPAPASLSLAVFQLAPYIQQRLDALRVDQQVACMQAALEQCIVGRHNLEMEFRQAQRASVAGTPSASAAAVKTRKHRPGLTNTLQARPQQPAADKDDPHATDTVTRLRRAVWNIQIQICLRAAMLSVCKDRGHLKALVHAPRLLLAAAPGQTDQPLRPRDQLYRDECADLMYLASPLFDVVGAVHTDTLLSTFETLYGKDMPGLLEELERAVQGHQAATASPAKSAESRGRARRRIAIPAPKVAGEAGGETAASNKAAPQKNKAQSAAGIPNVRKSEQWKFQRQFVPPTSNTKGDKEKKTAGKVRERSHSGKKRLLVSDTPMKPARATSQTPRSSSGKGAKDTPSRKYESVVPETPLHAERARRRVSGEMNSLRRQPPAPAASAASAAAAAAAAPADHGFIPPSEAPLLSSPMREGLRRSPRKSPNRSPRLGSPRGARGAHHDEDALPATPQRSKRAKRLFELID